VFVRTYGSGSEVVALHGFTLTGAQFAGIADPMLRIHAPDLPGHGRSGDVPPSIVGAVERIGRYLSGFPTPVPLLGYSQGGRIALLTALERPELVERLILVSTSPGIRDEGERADRRERDEHLADRIEAVGLNRFLDEWLDGPVTGTGRVDRDRRRADRALREENTAPGLAAALRGMGQGVQPYAGDRLTTLTMPVLLITGGRDDRYGEIAASMAAAFPDARHVSIPGAGHNVILEAPDEVRRLVSDFVADGPPA